MNPGQGTTLLSIEGGIAATQHAPGFQLDCKSTFPDMSTSLMDLNLSTQCQSAEFNQLSDLSSTYNNISFPRTLSDIDSKSNNSCSDSYQLNGSESAILSSRNVSLEQLAGAEFATPNFNRASNQRISRNFTAPLGKIPFSYNLTPLNTVDNTRVDRINFPYSPTSAVCNRLNDQGTSRPIAQNADIFLEPKKQLFGGSMYHSNSSTDIFGSIRNNSINSYVSDVPFNRARYEETTSSDIFSSNDNFRSNNRALSNNNGIVSNNSLLMQNINVPTTNYNNNNLIYEGNNYISPLDNGDSYLRRQSEPVAFNQNIHPHPQHQLLNYRNNAPFHQHRYPGNYIVGPTSYMYGGVRAHSSTQKKRYVCLYCFKYFTRPSTLKTHTYSHTGERPYHCDFEGCGKRFSVISNLTRHQKIHLRNKSSNSD
ncbi:hypothetical protein BB560_001736 [Smittium megazygosporum]|uniref:C2H2-type domain-containing protein n=1 Tax=Smittium megazygosporum TaxID=133381 RepID=A0A2T9ZGR4_9FUNG|nr:hypothetical protein BB560_002849 [Smittium megazygosporum]PVV03775.1 hypothetical protein BB560_001736 [Smittium megazygosporum]